MDEDKADQFAQIKNKIDQATSRTGQLSPEDLAAYADTALSIACISNEEMRATVVAYTNGGDKTAFTRLAAKSAKCVNLRDPSKVNEITRTFTGMELPQ